MVRSGQSLNQTLTEGLQLTDMVEPDIDTMAMQLLQAVGLTLPLFLLALQTQGDLHSEMHHKRKKDLKRAIQSAVILLSFSGVLSVIALILPETDLLGWRLENTAFNLGAILLAVGLILVAYTVHLIFKEYESFI